MPQQFEEELFAPDNESREVPGPEAPTGPMEFDDSDDPDVLVVEPEETPYGPSAVIAALDQIEVLVDRARAVPLSANVVLNKAEILDLVEQAREALPEDLVAADAVVADAEAVLIRADTAADAAVSEANLKAGTILEEARERADSIMREARAEAERTTVRAAEDATHTQTKARKEAEDVMADARAQAERLVASDSITEMANQRAHELITSTQRDVSKLRSGADDYVAATLGKTSELLTDLLRRTEAGVRAVAERQGTATDIDIEER